MWEDNWLPQQNGFRVWSKAPNNTNHTKVKDLIVPNTSQWNTNLIHQLFFPFEAQQICNIPLVDTNSRDDLTWAGTKDGTYSVKSSYHTISDWKSQQTLSGSNYNNMNPMWKHLWKLKIPPKQSHLIWRILNNALPVKDNLITRGIRCDPICYRCNSALETTNHVFLTCEWARAIWFGSPLTINFKLITQQMTFTEWLANLIQSTDKEDTSKIIAIIYQIWHARNCLIFQNRDIPAMQVVHSAMTSYQETQAFVTRSKQSTNPSATGVRGHNIYWTPPPKQALKLNVDAHPCGDGLWGLGLVLRSERGKCVGAMTKVACGSDNVVDGEAYGLNAALDLLDGFPDTQIIIEMDSSSIVNAVKKKNFPRCYWGRIARRCNNILTQNPRFSIEWVRRTGNSVAHSLANWAKFEPNKY
jgi:ribonuclease HI